ncbi:MAG: DUF222 domain-containing protein [Actinomycetota bacterium]
MSTAHELRPKPTDQSSLGHAGIDDLDRALGLLAAAEAFRVEAAGLLGAVAGTGLAAWLGYVSLERLIAHRSGCRNAAARELVRVARFLDANPISASALRAGELSWAQAESLASAVGDDRCAAFARHEADLLAAARGRDPRSFDRLLQVWRSRIDAEADAAEAERSWRRRSLTMQLAFDGSSRGRFRLDPVSTEIVAAALETPPDPIHTLPEPRTLAQRRADALVDLCRGDAPGVEVAARGGGDTRCTVDVVIDVETLAGGDEITVEHLRRELGRGGPITGPGLDRLLCDASFRALIVDGPRTVLAYNRATPDIPPALRRLVRMRDRGCVFPGCDRHAGWCDLHHIVPRYRGGPTTADNLTLLCRHHHGTVHDGAWQLSRAPDGTIQVRSP